MASARPAPPLGLGKRAVGLVELVEEPMLLIKRYSGSGVRHGGGETAIARAHFVRLTHRIDTLVARKVKSAAILIFAGSAAALKRSGWVPSSPRDRSADARARECAR